MVGHLSRVSCHVQLCSACMQLPLCWGVRPTRPCGKHSCLSHMRLFSAARFSVLCSQGFLMSTPSCQRATLLCSSLFRAMSFRGFSSLFCSLMGCVRPIPLCKDARPDRVASQFLCWRDATDLMSEYQPCDKPMNELDEMRQM